MRRFIAVPIALVTSACAMRPWTPSISVAYVPGDVPRPVRFAVPSQADAIARWQLPVGNVWAPYAKVTLLTALGVAPEVAALPKIDELELVRRAARAGASVAAVGLPADTLWLVDLRGAASVAFGATLSQRAREPVSLVPTFNNWPAQNELIPAEETLAALVAMTPRQPPPDAASRPVFLLDAWRLAYRDEEVEDDVTDNRYMLSPADLPDVALLQAQGIREVVYVVDSLHDTTDEEDDVHATLLDYQQAGIAITMVDLDVLMGIESPTLWHERFVSYGFVIVPRMTLVEDPAFYRRAHGGFGGVHGVPFHMGMVVGHGGG